MGIWAETGPGSYFDEGKKKQVGWMNVKGLKNGSQEGEVSVSRLSRIHVQTLAQFNKIEKK